MFEVRIPGDCELCCPKTSAVAEQKVSINLTDNLSSTQAERVDAVLQPPSTSSVSSGGSFHSACSKPRSKSIDLLVPKAEPHPSRKRKDECADLPDDESVPIKRQKIDEDPSEPRKPERGEVMDERGQSLESLQKELEVLKRRRAVCARAEKS